MITLMVNAYGEPAGPAVASATAWIEAIDNVIVLEGRYLGFPKLTGPLVNDQVFESEHAKRNAMLKLALPQASRDRFLLWIDCDERVTYASPQLPLQLEHAEGDVIGFRFTEPLPPDRTLVAGLGMPGRTIRDNVVPAMPGRLFRHLPTLEYRHRHDFLVDTDTGQVLMGWSEEEPVPPTSVVDLDMVHLWWTQAEQRKTAKGEFYRGPIRTAESHLRVGRNI